MNKEELLQELSAKIRSGELTNDELVRRLSLASSLPTEAPSHETLPARFSVTKMLYVLGAAIVVIGIVIFVSQVWSDIGSFSRIAITLGMGLLLTVLGSILLKSKPDPTIGTVFHAIGGVLIPGGAMVALTELNVDFSTVWPITNMFGVIFVFYLLLNFVHKNVVLTLFSVFNGTAFIYFLVAAITDASFYNNGDLYTYLTMIIGASYMLFGYSFRDGWNKKLSPVLYLLGITGILGAAFSQVFDSVFWQMIYFVLIIGGLFLSVHLKNRNILIMSTLFLIAHISYITSEYFADSLGWPISLIVLGFMFIGLGYASVNINKKYIAN